MKVKKYTKLATIIGFMPNSDHKVNRIRLMRDADSNYFFDIKFFDKDFALPWYRDGIVPVDKETVDAFISEYQKGNDEGSELEGVVPIYYTRKWQSFKTKNTVV